MRIVVIGTRGIPDIQGGVETHCQELYPRIVARGHEVTVIRRDTYVTDSNRISSYRGVRLIDVHAPRRKSLEAIIHTTRAILKARSLHPDIVHIHAIGPAIVTPLARLLGLKVVMTNHGPDYDRQKWGRLAKTVLRTGERWGTLCANRVIVISRVIADILERRFGFTDSILIYNGVNTPPADLGSDTLSQWNLTSGGYILAMGRLVKEKGFHDLIDAYAMLPDEIRSRYRLVIAGDADHPDEYSEGLKRRAATADGIVMTGFVKGKPLQQLLANAALFAMPSYHEGLPIALLEAMSHHLDVAVSDIPACRIKPLDQSEDSYPVGDKKALADLIQRKLNHSGHGPVKRDYNLSDYNWDIIADQTIRVYQSMI